MRRFGWIITIPVAVVVIVFAISNHRPATVSLWPFDVQLDLPVYAVAFLGIIIGFVAGAAAAWISGRKWRRLARREARDIAGLRQNLREKERQLGTAAADRQALAAARSEGPEQGGRGGGAT